MPTNCTPAVAELPLQLHELRHLLPAGHAPGRPEIDDQHLAFPLADRLLLPVGVGQRDPEQRLAVLPRSPAFAGPRCARSRLPQPGRARPPPGQQRPSQDSSHPHRRAIGREWALTLALSALARRSAQLNQDFLAGVALTGSPGRPPRAGSATVTLLDLRRIADPGIRAALRLGLDGNRGPRLRAFERAGAPRAGRDRFRRCRRTRRA